MWPLPLHIHTWSWCKTLTVHASSPVHTQNYQRQCSIYYCIICILSAFFVPWTGDRGANVQGGSVHYALRPKCKWVWWRLWLTNGAKTVSNLYEYHINVAYIIWICNHKSNLTTEETFKGWSLIFCTQDKMCCTGEHFHKIGKRLCIVYK